MNPIKEHDILIIGGGGAGLRAALSAAQLDPKLSIAILSKVYPTRSHTVSAEGGCAAAVGKDDNIKNHAEDTIIGSDYLADQDAVEFFVKHCKEEILLLEKWGCPWSRSADGAIAVRAFGGMSKKRTVFAADRTGFFMLHNLFERTYLHPNIHRYNEWYVTKLFTDDKGVTGVMAIHQKEGEMQAFRAKAVIIATGGAGKMYKNSTNSVIKTGDGMYLAYDAGAALKDMEFVQFHPTALPKTGILITEAARGEGGYLINNKKERFLKDYVPEKMELGPRDMITRAIISEYRKGNGFNGPYGKYVELDIRHLGEKVINEKLPQIRELAIEFMHTDPVKMPIPVTPAQHYTMGGISTDIKGQTTVPGLFAAGETACVSINGANRLGSNSLAECLVFGAQAGKYAATHAQKNKVRSPSAGQIKTETGRIEKILTNEGNENPFKIRDEMQETMDHHAGIIKNEKSLSSGIEKIKHLQRQFTKIKINQNNTVFNGELITTLELAGMLKLAEITLLAASRRRESRGAHYRTDYPKRNDKKFLNHLLISKSGGIHMTPSIKTEPVTITKWQPRERKY
ncbi:FAD-binding protein [Patescibacteria group bacterium]|nr:FAD-binding protein [Patescibacteria group bacterium]MBU1703174.1 FAD-binding protein [Patescibacteria group bacterium]MBU1954309.1 FAD-binding protein [Patescibacteria group bacterium]